MKKTLLLMALMISMSTFGQESVQWINDNQKAITSAEVQGKNIIVYINDGPADNKNTLLNTELLASKTFRNMASRFIFLKVDSTSSDYNTRLAAHYSGGITNRPVLTLVDSRGNIIGEPISAFNTETIQSFLNLLKDNQ